MSIAEMQACLARLYIDEPFRKLFYLDPVAALEDYRLNREESTAILSVERHALDDFAASLTGKRRKRVERAYPLLFKVDGTEIRRYYRRFCQLVPARPYDFGQQEVVEFGLFLEESLANVDHLPPYASDLAKYERLSFWALTSTNPEAQTDAVHEKFEAASIVPPEERPFLSPDVTIADFAYDVGAIEEALSQGHAPNEVHPGPACSIIFRPGTDKSRALMLRINAPTKAILKYCNARNTVSEIVTAVEAALGADHLHEVIIDTIKRLLAARVLAVDAPCAEHRQIDHRPYSGATDAEPM